MFRVCGIKRILEWYMWGGMYQQVSRTWSAIISVDAWLMDLCSWVRTNSTKGCRLLQIPSSSSTDNKKLMRILHSLKKVNLPPLAIHSFSMNNNMDQPCQLLNRTLDSLVETRLATEDWREKLLEHEQAAGCTGRRNMNCFHWNKWCTLNSSSIGRLSSPTVFSISRHKYSQPTNSDSLFRTIRSDQKSLFIRQIKRKTICVPSLLYHPKL